MTPYQLRKELNKRGSKFFSAENMKFAGDSMENFGVRSKPVEIETISGDKMLCWELYRIRSVKNGLRGSHFFACDTFEKRIPKPI